VVQCGYSEDGSADGSCDDKVDDEDGDGGFFIGQACSVFASNVSHGGLGALGLCFMLLWFEGDHRGRGQA
jgi:hypothetical protein